MTDGLFEPLPIEDPDLVEQLEDLGADLECAVSVGFTTRLVVPVFPAEITPTRESGFTVESYVVVNGHPVASPVSARTSIAIKGYETVPNRSPQVALDGLDVLSRWIPSPESYNGLTLDPVAGTGAFALDVPSGDEPSLLDSLFAYTVKDLWVSSQALDFTQGEHLVGAVPSNDKATVVMALVLRRPADNHCGLIEFGMPDAELVLNPFLSLRYTSHDEIQVVHNNVVIVSTSHIADETDVFTVGVAIDNEKGEVSFGAAYSGSRRVHTHSLSPGVSAIPAGGVFYVGRASGLAFGGAEMSLIDMAYFDSGDAETLEAALAEYASTYLGPPDTSVIQEVSDDA